MDRVILAGLYFYRNSRKATIVVDQEVHFALLAVVVVEQIVPMGNQFARYYCLINGAKIDALLVIKDCSNVVAVENSRKDAHIIQVKFEQVLACGLNQRENRIGNSLEETV